MKKSIIFCCACAFSLSVAQAQIAHWIVKPLYNQIDASYDADVILAHKGDSTFIWNKAGKLMAKTDYKVYPIKDGKAVAVMPKTDLLKGFYTETGKFIAIEYANVAYSHPYFSNGYLLVLQNGVYRYIDSKGSFLYSRCEKAFPFNSGYAACKEYEDAVKMKKSFYKYIAPDGKTMVLTDGQQTLKDGDVDFLTSLNDEGIGYVVAHQKIYEFNAKTKKLSPFSGGNPARVNGDNFLRQENDYTFTLNADNGDVIYLDIWHRPTAVVKAGQRHEFEKNKNNLPSRQSNSTVSVIEQGDKVGLAYNGNELLPPQFDSAKAFENGMALVQKDGKWGLVGVDVNRSFRLFANDRKDVGFRHRVFDTTIRLDLPAYIPSAKTEIVTERESGCHIDKRSWEGNDTENGNYVQYNCQLHIPSALSDTTAIITYPVTVEYDGLTSKVIDMPVRAWLVKYFDVDIVEADAKLNNGIYTFIVNIDKKMEAGEIDYPFSVNVTTDNLPFKLTRMSETRWKCQLLKLKGGVNTVNVEIMEQGCPPKVYPFEVTYQRPAAPVQIAKKPKPAPNPKPANHSSGDSNIKL